MSHRSRRRLRPIRQAGYTMIEVMMALAVLTTGAMGIMAMTQASTRGNMEAREMTTATQITQRWLERIRRDSLNWTAAGSSASPVLLANTNYLRFVPGPGDPTSWFVPAPPIAGPEAPNFDFYGRDTRTPSEMYYCTNVRLEWLYDGSAIRADVRVWWLRRLGGGAADTSRAVLGQCAPGTDPNSLTGDNRLRMTYASTVVRWTPMPRR